MSAALISGKFDEHRCELNRRSTIEVVGKGFDIGNSEYFQVSNRRFKGESSLYTKRLSSGFYTGIDYGIYVALFRNGFN